MWFCIGLQEAAGYPVSQTPAWETGRRSSSFARLEVWSLGTSDEFQLFYPSQAINRLCQLWDGYYFVILQLLNGACYVPVLLRCRAHSSEHQTIHEAPEHTEDIQLNNESGHRLARLYIHI